MLYRIQRLVLLLLLYFCCCYSTSQTAAHAWEWTTDWLPFASDDDDAATATTNNNVGEQEPPILSIQEITELRVRDIKRRLARTHGYSAEELGRILDKKELIQMLAFEEHKVQLNRNEKLKRKAIKRGILTAIIGIVLIMCWPLLQRAWDVAHVNFVVYLDRKKLEASRCWELQSKAGFVGIFVMFLIDMLQIWLTGSILLSWVMRSKYFFPVPSLSVRPAQMMGGQIAQSSLSNYGVNIGPMVVSWLLRFIDRKVESWTGKALSNAHKAQRRAAREWESEEEKAARKAARKQAKREAKAAAAAAAANRGPASTLPPDWMQPANGANNGEPAAASEAVIKDINGSEPAGPGPSSKAHEEFLEQLEKHNSEMDDLD